MQKNIDKIIFQKKIYKLYVLFFQVKTCFLILLNFYYQK